MKNSAKTERVRRRQTHWRLRTGSILLKVLLLLLLSCHCSSGQLSARAQSSERPKKLPSAQKVVENYLKAIGGKKRLQMIRDSTYEWRVLLNDQPIGTAKTQLKLPGSSRSELTFGNGKIISAANTSSAWVNGLDGQLSTLTGSAAAAAKLQALLEANHLLNYKKLNVLAHVVSVGEVSSEPAYLVEFSTRSGARLHYWFAVKAGLLKGIDDKARGANTRFDDFRVTEGSGGIMEPHRVTVRTEGPGELIFQLERAAYNTGITDRYFDAPKASELLDVPALLREVGRNQDEVEKRFDEYAFTQKEIDREITDKGVVKKETVKVFEVFPVANRAAIMKLVSENGVALSVERAAKEEKRVQEEFLKAERESSKDKEKADRRRAERQRKKDARTREGEDEDPELSQFLRACEFVSPRRERFRDREAVVFDFRPRPGFKPGNRQESLISKLVGVVWIDPVDKQIMRLEARLAEGFKMAGGLLLSLRPGAAFVMEQTRMTEGVWLPRLAQVNLSVKVLLFGGGDLNKTIEWSDYKHFKSDVGDYKLDAPKSAETSDKKP